jgi:AMP nucleosidase
METATLFTVGFHNKIPTGALLLVTDQPMIPDGVKTMEKDAVISKAHDQRHVEIGIKSLEQLINKGDTIRHLIF